MRPHLLCATSVLALAGCANDLPVVELLPLVDGPFYVDRAIAVEATVSDDNHELDELIVRWLSSIDGELDGPELAGDGTLSGELSLTAGTHVLSLEAEDPRGDIVSDEVAVNVFATNTPPTCSFTRPASEDVTSPGADTTISVSTADAELPRERLVVALSSDRDGDLGPVTLDSVGAASVTATLSTGTHRLTFTSTDELGEVCTAGLLHTVGSPPAVEITAPEGGYVQDIGEVIVFGGRVQDDADLASDLIVSWLSDRDGEFARVVADTGGAVRADQADLSRGPHTITLRATDSQGFYAEDSVTLLVNGPPTAPEVVVVPEAPSTTDPLEVQIVTPSEDEEGDTTTYTYVWSVNGTVVEDLVDTTVPAERTVRDEVWTVQATPNDGRIDGPLAESGLTVLNTAPELTSVTLSSTSPKTEDVLEAIVVSEDLDGDAVSYAYAWSVNGTVLTETGPTLNGSTSFDRGDTISVTVTPSDDALSGVAAVSGTATVINSPPTPPTLDVPEVALVDDGDVVCALGEEAYDADGDTVTYTVTWEADGKAYPGSVSGSTGPTTTDLTNDTIPVKDLELADEFTCEVVASDGTESAPAVDATFEVVSGTPYDIGYWREFPYTSILARNYLLGHPITVPRDGTITELGIIAKRTASNGKIALYTQVSGRPGAFVVGSSLKRINAGDNTFKVTPTKVTAGTYWIMAVYDSTAYAGEDRGRNTVYYRAMSAYSAFPSTFSAPRSYSGYRHNYYASIIND